MNVDPVLKSTHIVNCVRILILNITLIIIQYAKLVKLLQDHIEMRMDLLSFLIMNQIQNLNFSAVIIK